MSEALIDGHDVVMFDLDGVLYLGPRAVEGAVDGVRRLQERGVRTVYVTNNAARPVETVAEHLRTLGYDAVADDVVSSAQAATALMAKELPAGAKVLVCGTANLADHMREAGFVVVASADDAPDAVVQGYNPTASVADFDEAAIAVQNGARWYACNTDTTRPTDRGQVPGAGVAVYAVQVTTNREPIVTGKPYRPLMDASLERTRAQNALFVGDRLDTDIQGAALVGIDSVLVFTGVHGKADLVAAPAHQRPTTIAWDLADLFEPARVARHEGEAVACGRASVRIEQGRAVLDGPLETRAQQLDALWALATAVWASPGVDYADSLGKLNTVH